MRESSKIRQTVKICSHWDKRSFLPFSYLIAFLLDVVALSVLKLQGRDATALVGGTAVFILLILSLAAHKQQGLEKSTAYLIQGFHFGFKVFGPVIPIAAFFYLGDSGFNQIIGDYLPKTSLGIKKEVFS